MAERDAAVPALDAVRPAVDALLRRFLAERLDELAALDRHLVPVGEAVVDLVAAGGKRLRPAFVYWGHRATGAPHADGVMNLAAAVQLLHTFALLHDDVMDRSDVRRGRPAAHVALAAAHDAEGLVGDAGWFGVGGAILAGDLAFVWADQLFDEADLPADALARARRVFTTLRIEVMAGQYLDLRLAGSDEASESEARRVALLKSGRYTVTRPLHLGAAVAGAGAGLERTLAAYGDAVGLAFQLRDDVLGLFGDPATTGKAAVDDLREGKRTLLVLRALDLASPAERQALAAVVGKRDLDGDDADLARQIVAESGALAAVEALLRHELHRARQALDGVAEPARSALEELAGLAAFRSA